MSNSMETEMKRHLLAASVIALLAAPALAEECAPTGFRAPRPGVMRSPQKRDRD